MILRDIIECIFNVSTLDVCTDNDRGDTWFFMADEKSKYNLEKEFINFEVENNPELKFFQNCEVHGISAPYTRCLRVWLTAPNLRELLTFEELENFTFEIEMYSKRHEVSEKFTGSFADAQKYFKDTKICLNFILVHFEFNDNTFKFKFFEHDDAIQYMYN